jgi:hypothetical protein
MIHQSGSRTNADDFKEYRKLKFFHELYDKFSPDSFGSRSARVEWHPFYCFDENLFDSTQGDKAIKRYNG